MSFHSECGVEQWWSGPPGEGGGAEASLGSLCILNDELWGLQMVRLLGKGRKTGYGYQLKGYTVLSLLLPGMGRGWNRRMGICSDRFAFKT